jgi:hypothetical protein
MQIYEVTQAKLQESLLGNMLGDMFFGATAAGINAVRGMLTKDPELMKLPLDQRAKRIAASDQLRGEAIKTLQAWNGHIAQITRANQNQPPSEDMYKQAMMDWINKNLFANKISSQAPGIDRSVQDIITRSWTQNSDPRAMLQNMSQLLSVAMAAQVTPANLEASLPDKQQITLQRTIGSTTSNFNYQWNANANRWELLAPAGPSAASGYRYVPIDRRDPVHNELTMQVLGRSA